MIRAHAQAIKARLEQDTVLAGFTFQGVVINKPERYCTIALDAGVSSAHRFTGPSGQRDYDIYVHSVGRTPEQAQLVAERVETQLTDFTPVVANRRCNRLTQESAQPLNLDTDPTPPLYYLVSVYHLTSYPA